MTPVVEKKKRKDIDWEAIEREYRAGQLSTYAISRKHKISDNSIRKRVAKEGWARDLSEQVREQVRINLVRDPVRADESSHQKDRDIVEAAARCGVEVVRSHRRDISALKAVEQKLLAELDNEPTKLYITQHKGVIISEVIALTVVEKTTALHNLASVQAKRIELERQAFNLDDPDPAEGNNRRALVVVAPAQMARFRDPPKDSEDPPEGENGGF